MQIGGGTAAARGSRDVPRPVHMRLEELPSDALELIAQYVSTPSTPAACLLPLVCRRWSTAVGSAQLLVDITADLGPNTAEDPAVDLDAMHSLLRGPGRTTRGLSRQLEIGTAAAAAVPASLLRARQLAAWLAKRRGSVRSLCIPGGSNSSHMGSCRRGWEEDLVRVRKTLTARLRAPAAGCPLPHLVRLELPVLGLPGTSTFLKALAACTGLQQLNLGVPYYWHRGQFRCEQLAAAVAPLRQLRTLRLKLPRCMVVDCPSLATWLRQLSPSLEQVHLEGFKCSIPLSCITHLVHLRALELSPVPLVEDDVGSSSSSGVGCGAAQLTALTSLRFPMQLRGADARLQLPNLHSLHLTNGAEPAAWQQLQSMKGLRQLSIREPDVDTPAGLAGLTQLQHLEISWVDWWKLPSAMQPVADAVAGLVQLRALRLPALVVLAGGPARLTPLTQLTALTVICRSPLKLQAYPEGAEGWAATPAGAAVGVVAAAVGGGWGPLQSLVLEVPTDSVSWQPGRETVGATAAAALPGLQEVVATTQSR